MLAHQQQQTHLFIVVVLLLIPLTCVSYQSLGFEKKCFVLYSRTMMTLVFVLHF